MAEVGVPVAVAPVPVAHHAMIAVDAAETIAADADAPMGKADVTTVPGVGTIARVLAAVPIVVAVVTASVTLVAARVAATSSHRSGASGLKNPKPTHSDGRSRLTRSAVDRVLLATQNLTSVGQMSESRKNGLMKVLFAMLPMVLLTA
ncbi:MAG: hypothetical protein ACJAXA_003322 [Candidatus Aldehydirespiratoraceae bacterium]